MAISTKTFTGIVSDAIAAVQGAATQLIDMSIGSVLRAVIEACAAIVMWLQGIALQIGALTRFATSNGTDADTWAADYGFTRLPAQQATGTVTFSRFTATGQVVIPLGTVVQTTGGVQKYAVIADTNQTAYSATLGGYVMSNGASSCAATVQSVNAAAAANAAAGTINTIGGAVAGVDTVTNAAGFTTGADAESDTAFRTRFISYIASLSKATKAAIGNAITSIQQGVNYTLTEDYTYAGAAQLGYFYVVVDDGSGSPPPAFISTVSNAIDAVRPVCSTFGVFAPVVENANVVMTITTASGYNHASIVSLVQAALQSFINGLTIGQTLPYTKLSTIAYGASPAVTNVTGVTLNGGTADLTATNQQTIKAGTIAVS